MKELIGLKIVPHISGPRINYIITVSKEKRSLLFITNPTIRKIINENKINVGERIGEVRASYFDGIMKMRRFYPIGYSYESLNKLFKKTGTASLIETRILKHSKIKFPDIKYFKTTPSEDRAEQLKKREKKFSVIINQKKNYRLKNLLNALEIN